VDSFCPRLLLQLFSLLSPALTHATLGMPWDVLCLCGNCGQRVNVDILFTLFGVYGDVIRVKILFQKRDTALVQYATDQQAYAILLFSNQSLHTQSSLLMLSFVLFFIYWIFFFDRSQLGMSNLEGIVLLGSKLHIQASNKTEIKMPRPGEVSRAPCPNRRKYRMNSLFFF
jgi:hypothetical protein